MLSFFNCGSNQIPSDKEMIDFFNSHEDEFEKLAIMVEEDKFDHFPLREREKNMGISLDISEERISEYMNIMEKLSIEAIRHPTKSRGRNTIVFMYMGKGDATWGIDKGFEYCPDSLLMEETVFTESELWDEALKHTNIILYKNINAKWNLFLWYDK